MVHVNSLAMFALGRGLYRQTGKGKAATPRTSASDATAPMRKRAAMLCQGLLAIEDIADDVWGEEG